MHFFFKFIIIKSHGILRNYDSILQLQFLFPKLRKVSESFCPYFLSIWNRLNSNLP